MEISYKIELILDRHFNILYIKIAVIFTMGDYIGGGNIILFFQIKTY